jgi:hypothetical protein
LVNIAKIAYFGVEWSISAKGDLKSGDDVLGDQLARLKIEGFEKTRGTRAERGGGWWEEMKSGV